MLIQLSLGMGITAHVVRLIISLCFVRYANLQLATGLEDVVESGPLNLLPLHRWVETGCRKNVAKHVVSCFRSRGVSRFSTPFENRCASMSESYLAGRSGIDLTHSSQTQIHVGTPTPKALHSNSSAKVLSVRSPKRQAVSQACQAASTSS